MRVKVKIILHTHKTPYIINVNNLKDFPPVSIVHNESPITLFCVKHHRRNIKFMGFRTKLLRFESQLCDIGLVTDYLTSDSQILHM